jgi:hypothetical protein
MAASFAPSRVSWELSEPGIDMVERGHGLDDVAAADR